ncbi:MAG: hypothetical protein U5M51_12820 [Emticicia sp.]|nr:hypothetical protein [Emticicia sp.]
MKKILLSLLSVLLTIECYCQKADSTSFFFTEIPIRVDSVLEKNKNLNNNAATSTNNYLPSIIPPSPNASSLGKFGEIPVNLSSGLPNVSVPMFSLNEKK